jgi:FAD/FMN-containing dehydrogenase
VRGGGHSSAGHSSVDDGIVIDTGPMKRVDIDVARRTGRFGAGLTWGELDAATQEHGLAVTGGRVTHTGVAGLTLGSGSGWLERLLGPTAANLVRAEVVTADGRILRASADENPELFWGLKGGGGNFGVVTEFEFRLHPVGPLVYGGLVLHPRNEAIGLARFYRDFMATAPDEVGGALAMLTAPPEEFIPEDVRLTPTAGLILLYVGDPAIGQRVLRPLVEWGDPLVSMVQAMPYVAVQAMIDGGNPWGIHEYFKVDYLDDLPNEAINAAVAKSDEILSPFTSLILCPLGGAMDRFDRASMALDVPKSKWMYFCLPMWMDPAMARHEIAWGRSLMDTMKPWATQKAPLNFINEDDPVGRLRASFGEEKFARLVALKREYDPENVFRLNLNIPPN